jgi:DNA-binding HxlR family transcriptional regulator
VVIRTVYPSAPDRIEYQLSDLGTSLLEPLTALRHRAIDYLDDVVLAQKANDDVNDGDAAGAVLIPPAR